MNAMKIWAIMATLTAVVLGSFATGAAVARIAKLQRQPAAPEAAAPAPALGDGTGAAASGGTVSSFVENLRRRLRGGAADNAGGAAPEGNRGPARRAANASSNLGLDAGTEAVPLPRASTTPSGAAAPEPAAPAPAANDPLAADPLAGDASVNDPLAGDPAAQGNPRQAQANDPWSDPFLQRFDTGGGTWGGEGDGRRGREDGEGGRRHQGDRYRGEDGEGGWEGDD